MNEQSRINAMIAYLFLGPLFLLVRSDTPIGEPYVRAHAKRASIIMGVALVAILVYIFLLSPLFTLQLFGISLNSVILTVFMIVLSGVLVHGAYRAYHGIDARVMHGISLDTSSERIEGTYSEEEKVRIIASFIPFVGIYIAHKYSREPYTTGRKVGNMMAFILITLIVFYGGSVSTLVFALTIASIVLWIVTFVYLFFYNQLFSLGAYRYIPTYASIEAHIVAGVISIYDFFRVAFGGGKTSTYTDIYTTKKELYSESVVPEVPYILPTWIVALP